MEPRHLQHAAATRAKAKRGVKLALSLMACLLCWESVLPPRSHGQRAFAIAMQRAGRGRRQARLQAAWPFHVTLALLCSEPVLGVQLGEGGFARLYRATFCGFETLRFLSFLPGFFCGHGTCRPHSGAHSACPTAKSHEEQSAMMSQGPSDVFLPTLL